MVIDACFIVPDPVKVIKQISAVQAVILSSQLKEMLQNVNSQVTFHGMHKPIKLVYHPREPFFVIRQVIHTYIQILHCKWILDIASKNVLFCHVLHIYQFYIALPTCP